MNKQFLVAALVFGLLLGCQSPTTPPTPTDTSADDVATMKSLLVVTFASGDSAGTVTANLTLPTSGANGVSISWASNQPAVVTNAGVVTRPSVGKADASVTLTATLTKAPSGSSTKVFNVIVKAIAGYTVTFQSHGGTVVNGITGVSSGSLIPKPQDPTKIGYTFLGWYSDPGLTVAWEYGSSTVTANTTLYAKWSQNSYSLVYVSGNHQTYGGGGMPSPMVFSIRDNTNGVTLDQNLSTLNMTLVATASHGYQDAAFNNSNNYGQQGSQGYGGYYYVSPNTGAAYTLSITVTLALDGVTVATYALQENISGSIASSFVVSFNSNGGSAIKSLSGLASGALVPKPADPTKEGSTFAGWYKDSGLTSAWTFSSDTVLADTTLYAKWNLTVSPPDTSASDVASVKAALVIAYSPGDSSTSVTGNLTLPTSGANGVLISWVSDSPSVVGNSGSVTRPEAGQADASVTLTATLIKIPSGYATKVFVVTVKAHPVVDTSASDVASVKTALGIAYAPGDSSTSVTGNLTLPTSGANGVLISWVSATPSVVGNSGSVTRPDAGQADVPVTLTATLIKIPSGYATKVFVVTVKAKSIVDTSASDVALAKASLNIGYGSTDSAASVKQNLDLSPTGGNGVSVSWVSSNPLFVGTNGVVTRPAAGQPDAAITLTATLQKNSASDTKVFNVTIKALPPSSNADLSSLGLAEVTLSPVFSASTANYTASVANGVGSVTVNATKSEANATITGATGSRALTVGTNTLDVVVTAQDGTTTKTYTITVTRAAPPTLQSLKVWDNGWKDSGIGLPSGAVTAGALGSSLVVQKTDKTIWQWDSGWRSLTPEAPVKFRALVGWNNTLWGAGATEPAVSRWDLTWKDHPAPPSAPVSLTAWGTSLACLGTDGNLYLWDGVWRLQSALKPPAGTLSVAQAGTTRYALTSAGTLYRWDNSWVLDSRSLPAQTVALVGTAISLYCVTQ